MSSNIDVVFVLTDDARSPESRAARAWLGSRGELAARAVGLSGLSHALSAKPALVWCHWPRASPPAEATRRALNDHVRSGGGLLATLGAVRLPAWLGWEDLGPDEATDATWSPEAEDALAADFSVPIAKRGLQGFRDHPLFEGLGAGAYTWAPIEGERFVRHAYSGGSWPLRARVVAVDKSFIALNPGRKLAWEQMIGDGWVLCIGGYVYFAARDGRYRPHLDRLMTNALRRVRRNGSQVRLLGGEWQPPALVAQPDPKVNLPPRLDGLADLGNEVPRPGDRPGAELTPALSRAAQDSSYTVCGARALVVGHELSGHEEVWFHPFRAVTKWSLAGAGTGGDRSNDRNDVATLLRIWPGAVERHLTVGGIPVIERTWVSPAGAMVLVEICGAADGGPDASGDLGGLRVGEAPIQASWRLESDLRLMWPYPATALWPVTYSTDADAVGVQAATGEWLGIRVDPAPRSLKVMEMLDEERPRVCIQAELELGPDPVRILLLGAGRGEERWDGEVLKADAPNGPSPARRRVGGPVLRCGDPDLEVAVGWAQARLASYRVCVPELGGGLVAGFGRSGSSPFSQGRPGYAWYFGRDGCWTALACLCAGQFELVRETLELMGGHQDITGKIFHECTTSGVAHYDAADSTPLYLYLAARYLAWSGDLETLEREWPRIRRAYDYCLSTDTDGDGLIENTGVGHGWVEFGGLGGHHVSLYLAGVWTAALSELEGAARALGRREFADELAARAAAARASLELSFYEPLEGRYANGRFRDGELDLAETVMTAVPLALGAITPERCQTWLDRVAGADFSAPWGVRLVPRSQPGYRPDGYHAGAVWPLFTGWVSLAEYRAGRPESAFQHWEATARLYRRFALGAWPEVLHGEEPRSIGVTSNQAWSTAMVVLPLVEGALGLRPAAAEDAVEISAQLPARWKDGALSPVRVAGSRLSITWGVGDAGSPVQVAVQGAPLTVRERPL